MTRFTTFAVLALALFAMPLAAQTSFIITADGAQEVPANGSAAVATAVGWLDASNMLTITFAHDVVNVQAAHIHMGNAGSNGPVVFPFSSAASGTTETFGPLSTAEVQTLQLGGFYLNIHSMAFPGGEIRGQISATFAPTVYISEFCSDPLPPGATTGIDPNLDGAPATSSTQSDDEFVEIVNAGCDPVDIGGWTLADGFSTRHTFQAGTILPAFGAIVVFGGGDVTAFNAAGSAGVLADTGALGLNNSSDTITLSDATATMIDSYAYTSGGPDDADGESVVRADQQPGAAFGFHTLASPFAAEHSAGFSTDNLLRFAPAMLPAPATPMYPGNGSDVEMSVRINSAPATNVTGVYNITASDVLSIQFDSPMGTLTNEPFLCFVQLHTTGMPPAPEAVLGAFYDSNEAAFVIIDGIGEPQSLLNPVLGFYQLVGTLPASLTGQSLSMLVNCFANDTTKPFNFGIANAQEFQIQ